MKKPAATATLIGPSGEVQAPAGSYASRKLQDLGSDGDRFAAGLLKMLDETLDDGVHKVKTRCRDCKEEIILTGADLRAGLPDDVSDRKSAAVVLNLLRRSQNRVWMCERCDAEWTAAYERANADQQAQRLVRESMLPTALQGMSFEDMNAEGPRGKVIEAGESWAKDVRAKGLCLYGSNGVGKTRLAATIAWKRLTLGHSIRWASLPVVMAHVGAAWNDEARGHAIKAISGSGAMVIDDFDKANPSEWARNNIFTAVDTRVQSEAPLLITTNLKPSELEEKFGPAIASRVAGYCRVLELEGPDNRLAMKL